MASSTAAPETHCTWASDNDFYQHNYERLLQRWPPSRPSHSSPTAKTEKSRGVHHAIHSTAVLLLESGNSGSRSHGLSAAQRSVRTPTQQRPRADFALLPVLSALQQLNVSSRVVSHDLKVNFSQYSRCSWSKNFPNWVRRLRKQSLTRWLRLLHSGKYFFGMRLQQLQDSSRKKKSTKPVPLRATRAVTAAKVVLLLHVYRAFGIFYEAMQILWRLEPQKKKPTPAKNCMCGPTRYIVYVKQ